MPHSVHQKLKDSEDSYLNKTFWVIQPLFRYIQSGASSLLEENLNTHLERFPAGQISKDTRKQLEYLTVSLVNAFMIDALQGGVYPPDANNVADHTLRKLSQFKNVSELPDIIREAGIRLCKMAADIKYRNTGNIHVEKAKQYLSSHLTQDID